MSIVEEVLEEQIEIPLIRGGEEYMTQGRTELFDYRSNKIGEISECPSLILSQAQQKTKREGLKGLRTEMKIGDIFEGFRSASETFGNGKVLIGNYDLSPPDYAKLVTLASGIPIRVVEQSIESIKIGILQVVGEK